MIDSMNKTTILKLRSRKTREERKIPQNSARRKVRGYVYQPKEFRRTVSSDGPGRDNGRDTTTNDQSGFYGGKETTARLWAR